MSLLLVDFDGPLVRLLPDPEHVELARRLAHWCAERTEDPLPGPAVDHVQVLREIHVRHPALATDADELATAAELVAAQTRPAYPHAIDTLHAWLDGGGRVAVVSNNAEEAVRRVVRGAGLRDEVTIHARRADRLGALKPRPDVLRWAMAAHRTPPAGAVMIGDTTGDVRAGTAAGVPTIGIAESPERAAELRGSGAVATVGRLADLLSFGAGSSG
ncbi:MAG: HAD hydrolase-like protein [Propionibacteriaceae bacterium]|nr:HAD hydrolase-like protein [Propionibacteriaceae bacterium]